MPPILPAIDLTRPQNVIRLRGDHVPLIGGVHQHAGGVDMLQPDGMSDFMRCDRQHFSAVSGKAGFAGIDEYIAFRRQGRGNGQARRRQKIAEAVYTAIRNADVGSIAIGAGFTLFFHLDEFDIGDIRPGVKGLTKQGAHAETGEVFRIDRASFVVAEEACDIARDQAVGHDAAIGSKAIRAPFRS